MDRNQAKEFFPIMQAFAEGRVIECRTKPSTVEGTDVPNDWTEMEQIEFWNNTEYRIKPESTYRPFSNAEECWNDKPKDTPYLTPEVVFVGIEQRYAAYKHSVPSERSESHRRYYFKALPEKELSDEDMMYGERREIARCKLELYVLVQLLRGNLYWDGRWGTWFWCSKNDKDLIILRDWIEPNKGGA